MQSLICQPPQNAVIGAGGGLDAIELKGVAWSGGGSGIKRVDVSIEDGEHFTESSLYKPVEQRRRSEWGWTLFNKRMPLTPEIKAKLAAGEKVELTLVSKAVDSSFNVQPENPKPYVNPRGTAVNHWYRVRVTLDPNVPAKAPPKNPLAEHAAKGEFANVPSGGAFITDFNEGGWSVPEKARHESKWAWHKYSTQANTANEPGIEATIDWAYYRSLTARPWYHGQKVVVGEPSAEEDGEAE